MYIYDMCVMYINILFIWMLCINYNNSYIYTLIYILYAHDTVYSYIYKIYTISYAYNKKIFVLQKTICAYIYYSLSIDCIFLLIYYPISLAIFVISKVKIVVPTSNLAFENISAVEAMNKFSVSLYP